MEVLSHWFIFVKIASRRLQNLAYSHFTKALSVSTATDRSGLFLFCQNKMTDDEIEFEMNFEHERIKLSAAKLTEDVRGLLDAWNVIDQHRDEIALAVFQAVWFGHSINQKNKGEQQN